MSTAGQASMTGGLVQDIHHSVLPSVPPAATFVLAFLSMVPALVKLWFVKENKATAFLRAVILCSFGSYMFGW